MSDAGHHSRGTWRTAWSHANTSFYDSHRAQDHFSTSIHVNATVARQLARLIQVRHPSDHQEVHVIDIGSGSGRLLEQLRHFLPKRIRLLGVDRRPRPARLPPDIDWRQVEIDDGTVDITGDDGHLDGLLIAHEFLDDIPCDVVELDDELCERLVLVDTATGAEELGPALDDPAAAALLDRYPPAESMEWLRHWWPITRPAARREIGIARDRTWSRLRRILRAGTAVAVDYAHTRPERTAGLWDAGTLKGFRDGRPRRPVPDGSVNITAHVALDSCAHAGSPLRSQTQMVDDVSLDSWPLERGGYTWLIEDVQRVPVER
ncbi:MAG: SAM-dependent methyltransferase [Candidatus Nanopelagicales bacterium]